MIGIPIVSWGEQSVTIGFWASINQSLLATWDRWLPQTLSKIQWSAAQIKLVWQQLSLRMSALTNGLAPRMPFTQALHSESRPPCIKWLYKFPFPIPEWKKKNWQLHQTWRVVPRTHTFTNLMLSKPCSWVEFSLPFFEAVITTSSFHFALEKYRYRKGQKLWREQQNIKQHVQYIIWERVAF